jgi:hypothetical protein
LCQKARYPIEQLRIFQFAFPDHQDPPPGAFEAPDVIGVSFLSARDLWAPILLVALRTRTADPTAVTVPKTAVHEYRRPVSRKNEIGLTRQVTRVKTEPEAGTMNQGAYQPFWASVLGPDCPHVG